eukprot:5450263-Amphidinium_carterae.2
MQDEFFHPVIDSILEKLKSERCVLDRGNEWQYPKRIVLPCGRGQAILSHEDLEQLGLSYVSSGTAAADYNILEQIGCQKFSLSLLLRFLEEATLENREESWYCQLYEFMFEREASGET